MSGEEAFLELDDVSKAFGGVQALKNVQLRATRGSIHAVLGENGAGKSTLMKILAGAIRADSGVIRLNGEAITISDPAGAAKSGIVCIFQELSIIPDLTVAENICLADPPRNAFGLISKRKQTRLAREALDTVGLGRDIDIRERVADLPLPKRQRLLLMKDGVIVDENEVARTDLAEVMAITMGAAH